MPLVLQQYLDVGFETKLRWEQTQTAASSDNLQAGYSILKREKIRL